jgi:hypothetical protein
MAASDNVFPLMACFFPKKPLNIIPQSFWFGFGKSGRVLDNEKHRLIQDVERGLPSEPGYGILRGT